MLRGSTKRSDPAQVAAICLVTAMTVQASAPEIHLMGSGWALQFAGGTQDCTVAVLAGVEMPLTSPFTMETWVYPYALKDGQGNDLVYYNKAGSVLSEHSADAAEGLRFSVDINGAWLNLRTARLHTIDNRFVDATGHPYSRPFHLAWVRLPNHTAQLYVNGTLMHFVNPLQFRSEAGDAAAPVLSSLPWLLGAKFKYVARQWTHVRCFGGAIDEMRWWTVARSPAEIKRFATERVPAGTPGLFKQWHFDEGEGSQSADDGGDFSVRLGGGDFSKAPKWVPSPFASIVAGGPTSTQVVAGGSVAIELCIKLSPMDPGALSSISWDAYPALGRMSQREIQMTLNAGKGVFCGTATYSSLKDEGGMDQVPFTVNVTLSSGQGISRSSKILVKISKNKPPTAGIGRSVLSNGKDGFVALDSWVVPSRFSVSFWLEPSAVVDDAMFFSRHLTNGDNLLLVGFYMGRYFVRFNCLLNACYNNGVARNLKHSRRYPLQGDNEMVFDTGLTGKQVLEMRAGVQHIAMTFDCITLGNSQGVDAKSHFKIYVNGMKIGDEFWPLCFTPLSHPNQYSKVQVDLGEAPLPWVIAQEYDGEKTANHFGHPVKPSDFYHGIMDDVIFWKGILTDANAREVARGGSPRTADIISRYTFDLDDPMGCAERSLWDHHLRCRSVNEHKGLAVEANSSEPTFSWSPGTVGGVTYVRSPFFLVPGSPVHKTMQEETCASVSLAASDPDGDVLTYKLLQKERSVQFEGSFVPPRVRYCAPEGRSDKSVTFDVCDPHGFCSSAFSGVGKAVFHVLPRGPSIVAFQALRQEGALRLVFDMATNTPFVGTAAAVSELLVLVNASAIVESATWEAGGKALRLSMATPPWAHSEVSLPNVSVAILESARLRDAAETTYPSHDSSSALALLTCGEGELLHPGERACRLCAPGKVLFSSTEGTSGSCALCDPGRFNDGSVGLCQLCAKGKFANTTGSVSCALAPAGTMAPDVGTVDPTPCATGSYTQNVSNFNCLPCPEGTYQSRRGQSDCVTCKAGLTTSSAASTSVGACKCPTDSLQKEFGNMSTNPCWQCPQGLECPFGTEIPKQLAGYWARLEDDGSYSVFTCRNSDQCLDGYVGRCAEGRAGTACGLCKTRHLPTMAGCTECGGMEYILLFIWFPIPFTIALYAVYVATSQVPPPRVTAGAIAGATVGTSINFLQLLGIVSGVDVKWPAALQSVGNSMRSVAFPDVSATFKIPCVVEQTFANLYIMSCMPPVIVILFQLLLFPLTRLARRLGIWGVQEVKRDILFSATCLLLVTLFITMVKATVSFFEPLDNPAADSTIKQYPFIHIWSDAHLVAVPMVICALAFVIGFYSFLLHYTIKAPGLFQRPEFRIRFNFLLNRWRPDVWYFGQISLTRNLLIGFSEVIFPNASEIQMLYMYALTLLYFGLLCTLNPWKMRLNDRLDRALTSILLMILFMGNMLGQSTGGHHGKHERLITLLMCFSVCWMLAYAGYVLFLAATQTTQATRFHNRCAALVEQLLLTSQALSKGTVEIVTPFMASLTDIELEQCGEVVYLLQAVVLGKPIDSLSIACGRRLVSQIGGGAMLRVSSYGTTNTGNSDAPGYAQTLSGQPVQTLSEILKVHSTVSLESDEEDWKRTVSNEVVQQATKSEIADKDGRIAELEAQLDALTSGTKIICEI